MVLAYLISVKLLYVCFFWSQGSRLKTKPDGHPFTPVTVTPLKFSVNCTDFSCFIEWHWHSMKRWPSGFVFSLEPCDQKKTSSNKKILMNISRLLFFNSFYKYTTWWNFPILEALMLQPSQHWKHCCQLQMWFELDS